MRNAKQLKIDAGICKDENLFVNREDEKLSYMRWVKKVYSINNNILYVIGDKGVGKSSLLYQFANTNNKTIYPEIIPDFCFFLIPCIPNTSLISTLYKILYPKNRIRLNGGSLNLFGFGGGMNFSSDLVSEYDIWLEKMNRRFGNTGKPILIFIDDAHYLCDVEYLDKSVKVIFERIQRDYPQLNINFIVFSDKTIYDNIESPLETDILEIGTISYKDYIRYLERINIRYDIIVDTSLKPALFEYASGNFKRIISCLRNLEHQIDNNVFCLDDFFRIYEEKTKYA